MENSPISEEFKVLVIETKDITTDSIGDKWIGIEHQQCVIPAEDFYMHHLKEYLKGKYGHPCPDYCKDCLENYIYFVNTREGTTFEGFKEFVEKYFNENRG